MAGNTNNKEDLKKTNADDWLESIRKEYRIARKRYNRLYVLGLSMGGSIALIFAEEEEQKPDGLILYEPCLTIRNKFAYLAGFLKIFVPKMNFSPLSLPDNMEIYMQGPNGYYTKALQDLVKLTRRAKKNLSLVSVPFLCFYSLKDEMITFSGIKNFLLSPPPRIRTSISFPASSILFPWLPVEKKSLPPRRTAFFPGREEARRSLPEDLFRLLCRRIARRNPFIRIFLLLFS